MREVIRTAPFGDLLVLVMVVVPVLLALALMSVERLHLGDVPAPAQS